MKKDKLIIGTRGSALALQQARFVESLLHKTAPGLDIELRIIKTTGDKILDTALSKIGDKGLFTREIEHHLLDGRIDIAVHSLKDLPTAAPPGLTIAAMTCREDPADVLIAKNQCTLDQLPPGAVVLTGSLRRRAQLLHRRPDLHVREVRGNVPTRLRKLDESEAHALLAAAAGLNRLRLQTCITQRLDPDDFLPACGQGALAIQIRSDDPRTAAWIAPLDDPDTRRTVTAERTVLAELEGGCQVPLGAYARLRDGALHLRAMIADLSGDPLLTAAASAPPDRPESLGRTVAARLLDSGGRAILEKIKSESGGNLSS